MGGSNEHTKKYEEAFDNFDDYLTKLIQKNQIKNIFVVIWSILKIL